MSRYGASQFASLLKDCVLWAPLSGSSVTTTGKTVTANGNATQSTAVLDPWGLARPVGYFDGNGDYLTCGAAADWNFLHNGTTWGIAFWIKPLRYAAANCILDTQNGSSANLGLYVGLQADGSFYVGINTSSSLKVATITSSTIKLSDNNWHYVVITFDYSLASNNLKLYIDNSLSDQATKTANAPSSSNAYQALRIGLYSTSSPTNAFYGYISEIYILSGAIIASSIPTTRAKPDSYTKLLLHMYGSGATFTDDPFLDYDCYPVIPSGVSATNNGTFTKTDLGNNQSVLNFDGSTNYITLSDNAAWDFWIDACTISFWVNFISTPNPSYIFIQSTSLSTWAGVYLSSGTVLHFQRTIDTNENGRHAISFTPSTNTWYHVTFTKTNATATPSIYLNGALQSLFSSVAQSDTSTTFTGVFKLGESNSVFSNMRLKDLIIYKGRALTQPEIKLLMNRTHPVTGTGLMPANGDYYRMA